MKKRLLTTLTALLCATICTFGLVGCGEPGNKGDGGVHATAESVQINEVTLTHTLTGWGLSGEPTKSSDYKDYWMVDVAIYNYSSGSYYDDDLVDISKFSLGGLTPERVSSHSGEPTEPTLPCAFFNYNSSANPAMKTSEDEIANGGYTVTRGTPLWHSGPVSNSASQEISLSGKNMMRFSLYFAEEPDAGAQLKYNGKTVGANDGVKSLDELAGADYYTLGSNYDMLRMFTNRDPAEYEDTNQIALKTYLGTLTYTYSTPLEASMTTTAYLVDLTNVDVTPFGSNRRISASNFALVIDGQTYEGQRIIDSESPTEETGSSSEIAQQLTAKLTTDDYYKIQCTSQQLSMSGEKLYDTAELLRLDFGLTSKPETFKLTYGNMEVLVVSGE